MSTIRAIFEAIKAIAAVLLKVWPTWTESRQNRIDRLRIEREGHRAKLRELWDRRDDFLGDTRRCPDWLRDQIEREIDAIRRGTEELRALGSE